MMYALMSEHLIFPHPELANSDGILCVGGDLTMERLLLAYRFGIFPWYSEESPILWWSPNPRMVLFPSKIKVPKSMNSYFNQNKFEISYDKAFQKVIENCRYAKREGQDGGTWITDEMEKAYINLYEEGYAHSVEVWKSGTLVGGLYGLALGKVFYGESMFTNVSNASKFGFISMVRELEKAEFALIDCQQETKHLKSLGAETIPRSTFIQLLKKNAYLNKNTLFWDELRQKATN